MSFTAFGPHLRVAYCCPNITKLYDVPRDQWWTREEKGYSFVRTLFPNISIYVGLGTGQIAQLIPGPTPERNRTIMYYIRPAPPKDDAERQEIDQQVDFLVDVVDGEDYETGEQIQLGLKAKPFDHVLFGRNERGNQYFHKWLDWYLAEDETAGKPVL